MGDSCSSQGGYYGEGHCRGSYSDDDTRAGLVQLKVAAMAAIVVACGAGVGTPLVGRPLLMLAGEAGQEGAGVRRKRRWGRQAMAVLKSFAAGVMLGTAFVHILPDSFQALTHPCLLRRLPVCARFPFAGFASMLAALLTLMAEIAGTARAHRRRHHPHSSSSRRSCPNSPPHQYSTDIIMEQLQLQHPSPAASPSTGLIPAHLAAAGPALESTTLPHVPQLAAPPDPPPAIAAVGSLPLERSTSPTELPQQQLIMPPQPPEVAMAVYLIPPATEMRNFLSDAAPDHPNPANDHYNWNLRHKLHNESPLQQSTNKTKHSHSADHAALADDVDEDGDDQYQSRGRPPDASIAEKLRRRVIAQVLELGIVAHSIIIGISLGTSQSPCTIRPLIVALIFHQFFEGIALGGSIAEAEYESRTAAIMAFFFSMTSPVGIAIGMGIASGYNESSPTALLVEGLFDSISAGILVYMSLVDLIATDFRSENMMSQPKLQVYCYSALFLGAGAMSLLATWA